MSAIPTLSLPTIPPAATAGDPIDAIDTPSLVLDLDAFEHNLRTMQALADQHGVALRPHAKAHKTPEVALRQLALGARGVCCQKVSEAVPFVAAGITDIHISNEIVGESKLRLLAELARHARMTVCVDNLDALSAISQAAVEANVEIGILVDVDVGHGRCGVALDEQILALARQAVSLPGVYFDGLQAYHGTAQHVRDAEARKIVAREAGERAAAAAEHLTRHGIECTRITGAGTGTAELDAAGGVFTELQVGTYAFMDADYAANGWTPPQPLRHSLFLLATVMSTPAPGRVVVDVGLKSTTAENGLPRVADHPGLEYVGISDEHGVIAVADDTPTPTLGTKLRLIPSHCDPTFNLHNELVVVRDGVVQDLWPIAARGLSR